MAALTWRNVDTPNLAPALAGMQQFSQLLGQAFGGATTALEEFDASKTEKVSNEFIQNLLTNYSGTPDEMLADLQSGAIFEGVDRSRLNEDALNLLAKRPEDLLRFATTELQRQDTAADIAFQAKERGWTEADRNNLEAAKPVAALLLNAQSEAEADKIWKDNAEITGKLSPEMQVAMRRAPLTIINDELSLAGARLDNTGKGIANDTATFNLKRNRWEHNNAVVDRQAEEAGMAVASTVMSQARNGEEALLNLESNPRYKQMNPRAQAVARGMLQQSFGNLFAPGEVAIQGGGSTSDGSFESVIGNLIDREGGYVANDAGRGPTNMGINSQANPDVNLGGLTKDKAAKIYRDRYWKPVIQAGVPPMAREAVFDFGVTAGAGKAIELWKQSGGNLGKFNQLRLAHYEGLAARDPKKYGQYLQSWRNRVAATSGFGASPVVEAAVSSAQTANGMGPGRWAANLTDESNPVEVAKALRNGPDGKGGQFKGVPEAWISEQIRSIVNRSRVNGVATLTNAEAGRILADTTVRQQRGIINRLLEGDIKDTNLGNGYSTDNDALDARIADARRGGPQDRAGAIETIQASAAQLQAAQQAVQVAQAELNRLYQSGRPEAIRANRPRLEAKLTAARNQLAMIRASAVPAVQSVREQETSGGGFFDLFKIRRN